MLFWRAKSAKNKSTSDATVIQVVEAEIANGDGEPAGDSAAQGANAQPEKAELEKTGGDDTSDDSSVAAVAAVDDGATADETLTVVAGDEDTANAHVSDDDAVLHDAKVITLSTVRLADRLADLNGKSERADRDVASSQSTEAAVLAPNDARTFGEAVSSMQGQAAVRRALEAAPGGTHLLIVGPVGSGRRDAAITVAKQVTASRPPADDVIYLASTTKPGTLKPYLVPHGMSGHMVRDIQDALAKSAAMLARAVASDSHQMAVAVLEDDHRQRSDGGIEMLKRRAEAQNIALVRTSEGFVLAPMHEGRVVRSDVFRALPDALQRDVEAKIATLEGELQQVLSALSSADVATDDRHLALCQQTAERAIKPNLSMARKLLPHNSAVSAVFDAIEADWVRRATDAVRLGRAAELAALPSLAALGVDGHDAAVDCAPVIVAHSAKASDLLGEIGRDANGTLAVRQGLLARANSGILIIDAWRLALEPTGWAALSAALETRVIQPLATSGVAVAADPVPLTANIIVIGERRSMARLRAIDPRIENYFADVVVFDAAAKGVTAIGIVR